MNLDALRIFLKVAELASFTRAADHLGLPKARVSTTVRTLEDELGARLFQRTTRQVRITSDGERFRERALRLVSEADDVETMFRETKSGLRGGVRIDLPLALSRDVIIPRLPELVAEHPELELYVSSTDRMVNLYEDGFDCVLRVGVLRDSSLMVRHLGDMEMINCASPAYVRKYGLPMSLADLDRHTLVLYATSHPSEEQGWEYWDGSAWRVRPMRGTLTVNNSVAYKAACLAGIGIVQVPKPGMHESLASGELVEVLPELTCRPMPVSLLYSKHPNLPKRVRAVMAWLAEVVTPTLLRAKPAKKPLKKDARRVTRS